jgi:predicted outer membrane repeat protein
MNLLSNRFIVVGSTALLGAGGAAVALAAGSGMASANAPLSVTNLNDSGAGSLRQALLDANSAPGQDVITFATGVSGTISLLSDFPQLTEAIDLEGPGSSVITIDGGWTQAGGPNSGHVIFDIYDGPGVGAGIWTLSGFTVTGGNHSVGPWDGGGAITALNSAPLNIINVAVTANYSDRVGGGIRLSGTGNVVITHSSITGNSTGGGGGGLYADTEDYSTLTIIDSDISNNTAGSDGGGLYLDTDGGNVTIVGSTITNNTAHDDGGSIMVNDLYTEGSLTITDTVISGNHADSNGGALYSTTDDGSIFITDSTISNNTAGGAGGALYISSTGLGEIVIANSTISGNESTLGAGAMQLRSGSKVSLLQSTVTNNTGGGATAVGGIAIESDDLTLVGSIVAGNPGLDISTTNGLQLKSVNPQTAKVKVDGASKSRPSLSLSGPVAPPTTTADHSIIGEVDPAVTLTDGGGNKVGVADPMLGPLADNGGPTMTHALLAGSPAIDAGPNPVPTFVGNEFDQRGAGFARIVFGVADAGAFEFQEPPAPEEPIAPSFTG